MVVLIFCLYFKFVDVGQLTIWVILDKDQKVIDKDQGQVKVMPMSDQKGSNFTMDIFAQKVHLSDATYRRKFL